MLKIFVIENFSKPAYGHVVKRNKRIDRLGPAFDSSIMAEAYLSANGFNAAIIEDGEKPSYEKQDGLVTYRAYVRELTYHNVDSFYI